MSIKNEKVSRFIVDNNTELAGIRSIILFGKNTTSYKFALINALLSKDGDMTSVAYQDILPDFMASFLEHFKSAGKQGTNTTSTVFRACQSHLDGEISFDELLDQCRPEIHKNVFSAFHNIGSGKIDEKYSLYEWDKKSKVLSFKDPLMKIRENEVSRNIITEENESRWQIVEEAWKIGVSPSMVYYDEESEKLIQSNESLRKGLRSAVDALMPYQDGKCFYCSQKLNKFGRSKDDNYPEVDHVLPLSKLRDIGYTEANINGLWNLVLACRKCNGASGKGDKIPHEDHFNDLLVRNEYLLEEYGHIFKTGLLLSLNLSVGDKKLLKTKMKSIYSHFEVLEKWKAKKRAD